jgi:glycosyltransferase involved in cell wall biosynthesis
MKVLMISKALVTGAYQSKCAELAKFDDVRLTVLVPPAWQEPGGRLLTLESAPTVGYDLIPEPIAFNGHFHVHFYPGLRRRMQAVAPEIVHIDEEPYNLATAQALWLARRQGAASLFFTWQNLERRYPPPWSWLEGYVLGRSDQALAGSAEAGDVLRRKGYRGAIAVIPQFGVDPEVFRPLAPHADPGSQPDALGGSFTIGYVGRLVEEKGLLVLLRALARLAGDWRLRVTGSGPLRPAMERLAAELEIAPRVDWNPGVPSSQMPSLLSSLDCLVLPSLTRPNWKEQFGRVLVEAMACQIPVIGSTCAEIPNVIGDAGLVAREGDVEDLAAKFSRLRDDPGLRRSLGVLGRQRVLANYTQARVAADTHAVYLAMMEKRLQRLRRSRG